MANPLKIVVAGPIPRDTISTYENDIIMRYGCVTHPVIALAKLLDAEGVVVPVSNMHKKDEAGITAEFAPFKNIDLSGINTKEDSGTVILLDFKDQNNREEKQLACMNPIRPKHIKKHLDAAVFVFVPITDFEISLSTLKHIKKHSDATIVFDAHGATTAMDVKGHRHRKFWVDRDEWLPYIDVLKMNLEESQCMSFANEYEHEIPSIYDENATEHLDDLAKHVLKKGVSYFYVTMDSRGCILYSLQDNQLKKDWIASVKVDKVVDTTGCGDSFAGGLAYGFAKYDDPIKAGQFANILGARRTQGKNWDVFKTAEETENIRLQNYGE
ncbi:carbohydrate kinase family protein [Leeuwenhoekiella palythoae]|uniref:Adenosine kinase n=1 Tax=Leeuwenhoekiella palythoae TaxID=573501 RepID=A0A1M5YWX8_9FLAO|nr:carbohydrate kinase family protein [Leeuwenhoekiella palythoae]RXG29607.1 adenosine kinase [Leeuwenhoekiella palythoae]SHI16358.1 adenosine kinase [Leeuwenhoekiella palythoae]|tara:strand:+ start:518 stop:1498 length:981 start_codon:yes stop_codon:yes gene_type:complete